ncbi:hypothetical protein BJY59DRAFT_446917 [Rhodotorula toruloides]
MIAPARSTDPTRQKLLLLESLRRRRSSRLASLAPLPASPSSPCCPSRSHACPSLPNALCSPPREEHGTSEEARLDISYETGAAPRPAALDSTHPLSPRPLPPVAKLFFAARSRIRVPSTMLLPHAWPDGFFSSLGRRIFSAWKERTSRRFGRRNTLLSYPPTTECRPFDNLVRRSGAALLQPHRQMRRHTAGARAEDVAAKRTLLNARSMLFRFRHRC